MATQFPTKNINKKKKRKEKKQSKENCLKVCAYNASHDGRVTADAILFSNRRSHLRPPTPLPTFHYSPWLQLQHCLTAQMTCMQRAASEAHKMVDRQMAKRQPAALPLLLSCPCPASTLHSAAPFGVLHTDRISFTIFSCATLGGIHTSSSGSSCGAGSRRLHVGNVGMSLLYFCSNILYSKSA